MPGIKYKSVDPFQKWLEEPIYSNTEIVSRKKCIYQFVSNGLLHWIQENGYCWGVSTKTLLNTIATGLYENQHKCHIESEWNYPIVNNDYSDEEKDHYYHHLDTDMWRRFWSRWGNWSDVSTDSFRGQDRRLDIQEFVWGQLNLSDSPQINILNEMLYDESYDNDIIVDKKQNRTDIYLQDMAEYGGYGGYRK